MIDGPTGLKEELDQLAPHGKQHERGCKLVATGEAEDGATDGLRTRDLLSHSQALYP